jgi:hypothetical protein
VINQDQAKPEPEGGCEGKGAARDVSQRGAAGTRRVDKTEIRSLFLAAPLKVKGGTGHLMGRARIRWIRSNSSLMTEIEIERDKTARSIV